MFAQLSCSPPTVQPSVSNLPVYPVRSTLRMVRPSLLDWRFTGDSWIVDRRDGTFTLCLGDYCLVGIRGMNIDLPSLNRVLDRMRSPRWRKRARGY